MTEFRSLFAYRGYAHQSVDRNALNFRNFARPLEGLLGGEAEFAVLITDIDLEQDIGIDPRLERSLAYLPRDIDRVDRLYRVDSANYLLTLFDCK